MIRKMSSSLDFENVEPAIKHSGWNCKSVAEAIVKLIGAKIGNNLVAGLRVSIDGESVVVRASVPSFYVRQIVEHASRKIVVDLLQKTFVSSVVVRS